MDKTSKPSPGLSLEEVIEEHIHEDEDSEGGWHQYADAKEIALALSSHIEKILDGMKQKRNKPPYDDVNNCAEVRGYNQALSDIKSKLGLGERR